MSVISNMILWVTYEAFYAVTRRNDLLVAQHFAALELSWAANDAFHAHNWPWST